MSRTRTAALTAAAALTSLFSLPALAAETTLVPQGADWSYLDDGVGPGDGWAEPGFDDSGWASGPAQLGYGDGDEATAVSYGADSANKHVTTWFRHSFTAADPAAFSRLDLGVLRDDGVIVYLNGVEVFRDNLDGAVTDTTYATVAVGGADESLLLASTVDPGLLVAGTNVLAVEIHQANATSSDISFDLELTGADTTAAVTRGPYLQQLTADSVIVRWRTDVDTDSRVSFGAAPGALTADIDDAAATTEHEVLVTGLSADTTYSYAVGSTAEVLAGDDADHHFTTAPATAGPTRVWVLGDSGTADANARAVRDAYASYAAGQSTDLLLMLGDNAYSSGTDAEYQAAVFDTYPEILRQTPVWPTLGNHDGASASSSTQTGPYYEIFSLPTAAEVGGVASGTEAYYSFDYGEIHFLCLDSYDSDRATGGAMLTWLEDDLAATDARWVIAFWHHPPYSKGSHDSDTESRLVEMRENALPILDAYGVDLVLGGHSHAYERSYLLDGHYGDSTTLTAAMILDSGDGAPAGDGAYAKATDGMGAGEGAVYIVAGSSGKISGGALNHPAMFTSLNELGSLVLDIDGDTLDVTFLNETAGTSDSFSIVKGGVVAGPCDGDGVCEDGEDCDSCPSDCASGAAGFCGDGVCDIAMGEDCLSCASDCHGKQSGKPANRYCCGDGDGYNPVDCADSRCSVGEWSCSEAAGVETCCGDLVCEGAEDSYDCAVDCGDPPACEASELVCDDGLDEDCDGLFDCDDGDCAADAACAVTCGGGGDSCSANGDCCSGRCKGNGTCK